MLDFGLCRKFVGDAEQKDLRMPRASAPFRGTTRYAAIAALRQMEQSRKDDIEVSQRRKIEDAFLQTKYVAFAVCIIIFRRGFI